MCNFDNFNRFGGMTRGCGCNRSGMNCGQHLYGCQEALEELSCEAQRAANFVRWMERSSWNHPRCGGCNRSCNDSRFFR